MNSGAPACPSFAGEYLEGAKHSGRNLLEGVGICRHIALQKP